MLSPWLESKDILLWLASKGDRYSPAIELLDIGCFQENRHGSSIGYGGIDPLSARVLAASKRQERVICQVFGVSHFINLSPSFMNNITFLLQLHKNNLVAFVFTAKQHGVFLCESVLPTVDIHTELVVS